MLARLVAFGLLVPSLMGLPAPRPPAGAPGRAAAVAVPAGAPTVARVEPPEWWVGHSRDVVQLLVSGSNLAGCALVAEAPGVTVERQTVSRSGDHMIAYVRVGAGARPGPVGLSVRGPNGSVAAPWRLLEKSRVAPRGLEADDVIYLVMPDRFADGDTSNDEPRGSEGHTNRAQWQAYHGGDFAGLRARLPYLKALGVTAIWMTPVYDNDDARGDYHGYGATDMYGVEEHLGTMDELRALVDAAHALGLKVVQDQVANHVGRTHPWVDDPPTPTWIHGTRDEHLDNTYAIESLVDPAADPAVRRSTLDGWFANRLPDLDQHDPEVATYLVQNSLWWVGRAGFDAIREDTLPYAPRAFWAAWTAALRAEYPRVSVVGEVYNRDPKVVAYFQGGEARDGVDTGVGSLFDFPLAAAIVDFFSAGKGTIPDGKTRKVDAVLAADGLYPDAARLVPFLANHDMPRALSMLGGDARVLRLATLCLMTMRGIPHVYYGDEIAMPGFGDPDNRRDFPGGFPGDAHSAFAPEQRTEQERQTFEAARTAIALRRDHPALRGPTTRLLALTDTTLAYAREGGGERALVLFNNADVRQTIAVPTEGLFRDGTALRDALAPGRVARAAGGRVSVDLGPRSAAVLLAGAAGSRAAGVR